MRQATGEKQTFLVLAKSYKIISGSVWEAILYFFVIKTQFKEVECDCRFSNEQI